MQQFLLLLGLAILLSSLPSHCDEANQQRHILPVSHISVVDGDTYRVLVLVWPGQHVQTNLRLRGWDAPESTWRASCAQEEALGKRAASVADSLISAARIVEMSQPAFDKYGGRMLGLLLLDGVSIGKTMERLGLLQRYEGKGDKPDWCGASRKTVPGRKTSWGAIKQRRAF